MDTKVFSDLKIAAFSWAMVGPLTLKFFADYGATVVRVETSRRPCVTRTSAPFKDNVPGINRSGYFNHFSANMMSVSLDMKSPGGRQVARELVAWSDVVMENFTPGVMDAWGLGYEELERIRPGIILVRQNGFGTEGPYRNLAAFGMILAAVAGIPNYIGWPDGGPLPVGVGAYTDCISPRFASAALIAALEYRDRTGAGQLIDLAQFETALYYLLPGILDTAANGREPVRSGNAVAYAAPHNVYPCKGEERWCTIAVTGDTEWRALCRAVGRPELADDPRFATTPEVMRRQADVLTILDNAFAEHTLDEWADVFTTHDIWWDPVQSFEEVVQDPVMREAGVFRPMAGDRTAIAAPADVTPLRDSIVAPAPELGQHTEEILLELGHSWDDITGLMERGVIP